MTEKTIQRLETLLSGFDAGAVQPAELMAVARGIMGIVKEIRDEIKRSQDGDKQALLAALDDTRRELVATERALRAVQAGDKSTLSSELLELRKELQDKIEDVAEMIPELPDLSPLHERMEAIRGEIPEIKEQMAEDIRNKLELLEGDERLDKKAIRGIEDLEKAIAEAKDVRVVAAPSRGFFVYVDGVKKGLISAINFKAGSNMAISHSKVNGLDTITFTSSGGAGGLTIETPTGTVNGTNTAFTVSAEPQYMIADGSTYFNGAGYTYAALTVTFDIAPSQYVRAII